MNYFGLFFTFMIPGVIIGTMATAAMREGARRKQREAARARRSAVHTAPRNKLYICTLNEEAKAA